jgi:hypothetical protein
VGLAVVVVAVPARPSQGQQHEGEDRGLCAGACDRAGIDGAEGEREEDAPDRERPDQPAPRHGGERDHGEVAGSGEESGRPGVVEAEVDDDGDGHEEAPGLERGSMGRVLG